MTDTMHLGLPFIEDSQAQKHVTHNEALRILDAVIQIVVEDVTRTTPPSSPAEGQRHVIASGASGAWAGHAGAIATWQDSAWVFLAPKTGWCLWSVADASIFIFDGSAWQALAPLANDVGHLGVNTTASMPNLLSVKSNAALLAAIAAADGGSGDVRLQISKEAPANTASVFFSDNYSGRAEFGLTGDDHFHLKVSPDGASWQDAFVIDKSTGNIAFHGFSDAATTRSNLGLTKQTSLADATAGRLMTTGAFGLGGAPINLTSGDSAIAVRPTGFYFCNGSSNTPLADNGWLNVIYVNANYCVFEYLTVSSGRRFCGELLNNVWSGWKTTDTLRGSNATGQWVIYPTGLMICTQKLDIPAGSWSTNVWGAYRNCGSWSLPATFSQVFGSWVQTVDGVVSARSAYTTYFTISGTTIADIYVASPTTTPGTAELSLNVVTIGAS